MRALGLLATLFVLEAGCSQDSKKRKSQLVPEQNESMTEIESAVRRVVGERLRVKPESLDMKAPIADELDVVQIVMTLEERLMFDIPDQIIEKHSKAKLGEPACKLSPAQLVVIAEESRALADRKR